MESVLKANYDCSVVVVDDAPRFHAQHQDRADRTNYNIEKVMGIEDALDVAHTALLKRIGEVPLA